MNPNQSGQKCACPHHKVVPILVVLFGLTFLLGALGTISPSTVSIVWPIIVILVGLQKVFGNKCKCCSVNH